MDNLEVPNCLDTSNFSGVVGIETSSKERMSKEKVEMLNIDCSWALL